MINLHIKDWIVWLIILFGLLSGMISGASERYQFLYIGPFEHDTLYGARQGVTESNLQGEFLGGKHFSLTTLLANEWRTWQSFAPIAIFTTLDNTTYRAVVSQAVGIPVFNLNLTDNALRYDCLPNAFHLMPSAQMLSAAEQQWQKKHPGSAAVAQAWHPDFKKFAARDLNKRFLKAHGITMNDHSWSGWAGTRMVADAILRSGIQDASILLNYLQSELAFDGQKGQNMTFRDNGQLRQLLLLVEAGKLLGEAPVSGVASSLDSLGITECAK